MRLVHASRVPCTGLVPRALSRYDPTELPAVLQVPYHCSLLVASIPKESTEEDALDRIIPVSELRANLSAVTKWIEQERQPVFLTKNGHGRYVLIDVTTYNELLERAEIGAVMLGKQDEGARAARIPPAGFVSMASGTAQAPVAPIVSATQEPLALDATQASEPAIPSDYAAELSDDLKREEMQIMRELGLL